MRGAERRGGRSLLDQSRITWVIQRRNLDAGGATAGDQDARDAVMLLPRRRCFHEAARALNRKRTKKVE